MNHGQNCLINVDRECGYCTCGAQEREDTRQVVGQLRAEVARLTSERDGLATARERAERERDAALDGKAPSLSEAVRVLAGALSAARKAIDDVGYAFILSESHAERLDAILDAIDAARADPAVVAALDGIAARGGAPTETPAPRSGEP